MNLDRMGARDARRARSAGQKFQNFSKAWQVGDKLSIFFPIMFVPYQDEETCEHIMVPAKDAHGREIIGDDGNPVMVEDGYFDIVVSMVPGHAVTNLKEFPVGNSFIPSLTEVVDMQPVVIERNPDGTAKRDQKGDIVCTPCAGDAAYQFSKIAPLFIKGMKQYDLDKAASKNYQNESLRKEAIARVEEKYDTKSNMDAKKPIISKLQYYTSTEVIAVPVDGDRYRVDKAGQFTYKLSNDRIDQLAAILDDPKYRPADRNQKWVEVQMTFNGSKNDMAGRSEAGRKAVPVGLTHDFLMENVDPDGFSKVKRFLANLPEDSKMISKRNFTYRKVRESDVIKCIQQYVTFNSEYLDAIAAEDDTEYLVGQAVALMKIGGIASMTNKELKDKILGSFVESLEKKPDNIMAIDIKTLDSLTDDEEIKATLRSAYEQQFHTEASVSPAAPVVQEEPSFEKMPTARELAAESAAFVLPDGDDDDSTEFSL